mgnify:CR=1 FL=1
MIGSSARELASVEVFDPATGAFTAGTGAARLDQTATLLANRIVLLTGGHLIIGGGAWRRLNYDRKRQLSKLDPDGRGTHNTHTAHLLDDGSVLVVGGTESPGTAELLLRALRRHACSSITVPADITTLAPSPAGAEITYMVSVTDDSDPNPTLDCRPASGAFSQSERRQSRHGDRQRGQHRQRDLRRRRGRPLQLLVRVDAVGFVSLRTGTVTVTGTITCNRGGGVFRVRPGQLTQSFPRRTHAIEVTPSSKQPAPAEREVDGDNRLRPRQASNPGLVSQPSVDATSSAPAWKPRRGTLLLPTLGP